MENQNTHLQPASQPDEMAGRRDCAVGEHICTCCNGCECTGPCEHSCFDTRENGAAPEDEAVEQSACTETYASGAIEEGTTAETAIVVEENISITPNTSLAVNIQTSSCIREHPCAGRYQIETTPSLWNRCGVFALEISTWLQLKVDTFLTYDQFMWILTYDPEMLAFNARHGWGNRDNFFDEQLACALRVWGRHEGLDLKLQLGVIAEGAEFAYIIGKDDKFLPVLSQADMKGEREFTTVWIHNDNAQELFGGRMNHYSGLWLLDGRAEQEGGSKGEGANGEDPDTEIEQGKEEKQEKEEESSEEDSSTLSDRDSNSDAEMADDEKSGQETGEETSDEESTDEGSDMDVEDKEEMGPKTEEEIFPPEYSSMRAHGGSSAKEDSDVEMADDEDSGQEMGEEVFTSEYSSMPSEEGSEMEMEDDEGMGQEADDEKFAEDSKREGSYEPPEECESKGEDSQSSP